MRNKPDHTLEEVLAAVDKGITKTGTAKVLGVHRDTISNYAKRWKSVDDALRGKRRELVDLAEMGLRGAVLRQEHWAVTYALSTLGKDDGYTSRSEVTTPKDQPFEVKVTDARERLASRIASLAARNREAEGASRPDGEGSGEPAL